MKKYLNYKLPVFGLMVIFLASCYSDQQVAAPIDPSENPTVTITPQGDYSTLTEGDVLEYLITIDEFLPEPVEFEVQFGDNSVASASDFSAATTILAPYTDSVMVTVTVVNDQFPEVDETIEFEINADDDYVWNWLLDPGYDREATSGTIVNSYIDSVLSIGIYWPVSSDDWDAIVYAAADTSAVSSAFTGADPEVVSIDNDLADGNYVVVMDPWDVSTDLTEFLVTFNTPDGAYSELAVNSDLSGVEGTDYKVWDGLIHVATITKSGTSYAMVAP